MLSFLVKKKPTGYGDEKTISWDHFDGGPNVCGRKFITGQRLIYSWGYPTKSNKWAGGGKSLLFILRWRCLDAL